MPCSIHSEITLYNLEEDYTSSRLSQQTKREWCLWALLWSKSHHSYCYLTLTLTHSSTFHVFPQSFKPSFEGRTATPIYSWGNWGSDCFPLLTELPSDSSGAWTQNCLKSKIKYKWLSYVYPCSSPSGYPLGTVPGEVLAKWSTHLWCSFQICVTCEKLNVILQLSTMIGAECSWKPWLWLQGTNIWKRWTENNPVVLGWGWAREICNALKQYSLLRTSYFSALSGVSRLGLHNSEVLPSL